MRGFLNSIFYAVVGTAVNVMLTLLAAYPLSRKDLRGRGAIMFFFFFTTLFSGGLIPTYLVVARPGAAQHPLGADPARGALGLEPDHHPHLLPDHHPR